MNARRLIGLVMAALVVVGAAMWVSVRSGPERVAGDQPVLVALAESLDSVNQVRLSRGDGAATTLQRRDNGWFVAQRDFPADPGKLRSLMIQLSTLRAVEQKTSDPAHYGALNVEDAAGAQSHSVRIDVAAGARTWSLLLGKAAEPSGGFVRVPGTATALLAQPRIEADPQPTHWIKTELIDLAADRIQQVTVHPAAGPSYWIARDARGVADLTLHGVPPGRKPAAPAVVDAVARTLRRLNAEDVKQRAPGTLEHPNRATFRTFEGLQLDVDGYREGASNWIRVNASVDQETARRFAATVAAGEAKAPPAAKGETKSTEAPAVAQAKAPDPKSPDPKAPDAASEAAAINSRLGSYDFQIPVYQYDALYRQLKELLAAPPEHTVTPGAKPPK
jgi:hypothetical protein